MMKDLIRRFKPAYALYNFFHRKELAYLIPLYKKYGLKKKYFSPVSSEDLKDLVSTKNWLDQDDAVEKIKNSPFFQNFTKELQENILRFPETGFLVIPGLFREEADKINQTINDLLSEKKVKFKNGNKIMFGIHKSKYLKKIGQNKDLVALLEFLLGKKITLFSSINFIKASEQRAHSDEYHMTTFPHANIIAAWVALEDVSPENGTLFYYPGSHKLDYIMNKDFNNQGNALFLGDKDYKDYEERIQEVINENKLEYQTFNAKKGDVLIWHANLLHGGLPVKDKNRTRKSMVFHYYAEDAICFHEVTQRPTLLRYR